jgi:hypothetical protein
MTDLQNFTRVVDGIFGAGTCRFDDTKEDTNNVIGALALSTDYHAFRRNFIARLNRLHRAYDVSHSSRKSLLDQVNEVANPKNWEGAVAELAAFDFFNSQRNFLFESPDLDVSIDPSRSLAAKFGMSKANLDIRFSAFDVFTDVKVLKDNVAEILQGIYKTIWPTTSPLVHSEYPLDAGYEEIQAERKNLLNKLSDAVSGGEKPTYIDCSGVVSGLKFRLEWERGALVTESSYSPYRHAREMHRLPLVHAKKFVTDRPFFLTFVTFPWFNNTIMDFRGSNKIFYRSLARRVFCQYRHDSTRFSTLSSKFTGTETIYEVSQQLDAVLFLEDRSISGERADDTNVEGFYYENPNAHNPPSRGMMDAYLQELVHGDYDNFRHDNY